MLICFCFSKSISARDEALLDLKFLTDTVLNEEENAEYNLKSYINSLFTITVKISTRSLVNFYCQYEDRHMNDVITRGKASKFRQNGSVVRSVKWKNYI